MEELKKIEDYTLNELRNHTLALALIKENIYNFNGLPDDLKSNEEFMFEACQINGQCLLFGHPKFLRNENICKIAVIKDSTVFEHIKNKTKDICLLALEGNYKNWDYVPHDLKNNESFIKQVAKAKLPFNYFPKIEEKFQKKKSVAKAFLSTNGLALSNMNIFMQNDKELVLLSLKNSKYMSFDYMSSALKNDPEFLMDILPETPNDIRHCGEDVKKSLDVALALFSKRQDHVNSLLYYFSPEIRNNFTVATQAALRNYGNMEYVSDELKGNIDFVKNFRNQIGSSVKAIQYISPELKKDCELMKKCIGPDWEGLRYIDSSLKENPDYLNYIFHQLYAMNSNKIFEKLQIKQGDERAVLYFLNAAYPDEEKKLYVPEECKAKLKVLHFHDPKFYLQLMEHPNPYHYLVTTELSKKLDTTLNLKEKKQSKKI